VCGGFDSFVQSCVWIGLCLEYRRREIRSRFQLTTNVDRILLILSMSE
jgi:hypothetical protein